MSRNLFDASRTAFRPAKGADAPPQADSEGRLLSWHAVSPPPPYQGVVQRAFDAARRRLPELMGEPAKEDPLEEALAEANPSHLRLLALNSPKYHRVPVCERLIEHALAVAESDPDRALGCAEVAVELAGRLTENNAWGGLSWDILARAWSSMGHVCRLLGDAVRSERAFQRAERCLAWGTGDPTEEAQLLRRWAELREQCGEWTEAEVLLDRGARLDAGAGNAGALLAAQASLRARRGDLVGARRLCWSGLKKIRGVQDRLPLLEVWRRLPMLPEKADTRRRKRRSRPQG